MCLFLGCTYIKLLATYLQGHGVDWSHCPVLCINHVQDRMKFYFYKLGEECIWERSVCRKVKFYMLKREWFWGGEAGETFFGKNVREAMIDVTRAKKTLSAVADFA